MPAALEASELLAAEPAQRTHIRSDTPGVDRRAKPRSAAQGGRLAAIFAEKLSGRDTERPQLTACLEFMAAGDTLVVPALDRLSRSLQDLITTVGDLRTRGVGFTSRHENLDTTTPGVRLVFHVSGTREGLAAARDMLPNSDASLTSIAKLLGVNVGTLYNHIPTSTSSAPAAGRRSRTHERPHRHDGVDVAPAAMIRVRNANGVSGMSG